MKTETIVSGIRATGQLHVGNYLGALKQFVDLQNSTDKQCFFFIADLHALTTPFEPKDLRRDTLEVVAEYIAAGLDPKKSVVFIQNHVPEHAELTWILNCITPIGELFRMTQFKNKASLSDLFDKHLVKTDEYPEKAYEQLFNITKGKSVNAGLLTYPVLMAADILLYKPTLVPVGDDQTQHLELARIIARKFNNRFGKTFPEPKNYLMKPLRVISLTHPEKKMSKTGDEALMLGDAPKEIARKLKKAVTASTPDEMLWEPSVKVAKYPSVGVENLMLLLDHFGSKKEIVYFHDELSRGSIKYSQLKETLANDIAEHFAEFRQKKQALLNDTETLAEILADGARRARAVAHETLLEVKQKVGLL